MAEDFDPKIIPDLIQTTFSVSLGAAFKGLEMMGRPADSVTKMVSEVMTVFNVPENTGNSLPDKIQAIAGNMMMKGANLVGDLKAAGDKFTEGK